MDEIEFIDSIDACFPYKDEVKWRELIRLGAQISDNASFMVLHEICRAPNEISQNDQLQMLKAWDSEFSHPIKEEMLEIAKSMIAEKLLPTEKVIKMLEKISRYKGLYNALGLVYFACNDETGKVDAVYKRIIKKWREE